MPADALQHVVTYDLARGLHVIAVIAWIAGLLMLPRFYAAMTSSPRGGDAERAMLKAARGVRTIVLFPALILSWAFGTFLFATYFMPNRELPIAELVATIPAWFWLKLILVVGLTFYQGFLVNEGRRLAAGHGARSERFWRTMSIAPFIAAMAAVLLATLEP